ncbi:MAG: hypothetical protein LBH70_09790 [Spirochaetaceae bacterium]|nr:hypothetical protein [Spirochaetaceae bacterium]
MAKDDRYQNNPGENGEVPAELEELEALGEPVSLRAAQYATARGPIADLPAVEQALNSGEDIAVLAREIEFTPLPEDETGFIGGNFLAHLEIVSPFVTMLAALGSTEVEKLMDRNAFVLENQPGAGPADRPAPGQTTSKVEILDENYPMSLVYQPFTRGNVPPLGLSSGESIIESRNGVNYINASAFKDNKLSLDKEFQRLIDSVLT